MANSSNNKTKNQKGNPSARRFTFRKVFPFALVLLLSFLSIALTLILTAKEPEKNAFEEQKKLREAILSDASPTVLSSTYKETGDYTWQDLYALLIVINGTTPVEQGEMPETYMLRTSFSNVPLLFSGVRKEDGTDNLEVYSFDGKKVYKLLTFEGTLYVDEESGLFYDPKEDLIYEYQPHIFRTYKAASCHRENGSFHPIAYSPLSGTGEPFVVENIESYVTVPEVLR